MKTKDLIDFLKAPRGKSLTPITSEILDEIIQRLREYDDLKEIFFRIAPEFIDLMNIIFDFEAPFILSDWKE